jgi:uncharacterized membrane protein YhhN
MSTTGEEPLPEPSGQIHPPEVPVRTITLVRWGILAWAVVLVLVLAVPALRSGERAWWVWVPVAGMALGAVGHVYLRRGRGNAEFA